MTYSSTVNLNFAGPTRSVVNFAELRRLLSNTLSNGDNVVADGLATAGDGAGGMFVYDALSVLADNNANTVKPLDLGDGEPGRWLIIARLSADSSAVAYGGQYASVRDALDAILYVAPVISGFAASPAVVELGSTIPTVALTWTLNKAVTSEAITGLNAFPADTRAATALGPFTSDRSWTLTANDGKTTVTATTGLAFRQKRYWGVSASPTLTNADILALNGEFSTSKAKSTTYDCTGGRYPYFVYPASFGDPAATVGGFGFSDFVTVTQSVTNASGYTSDYKVARFGNLQNGSAISTVWS